MDSAQQPDLAGIAASATPVVEGLAFGEGPRWHDGALWFSDMHAHEIHCWHPDGHHEIVAELRSPVSGLGFLPDGGLVAASMHERRVVRIFEGRPLPYADLSRIAEWHINDLLVTADGTIYVGNFGDESAPPAPPHPARLALVQPGGRADVAAQGLCFANGMVQLDDHTLVVAETRSEPPALTAFTITDDGTLTDRRPFATFEASRMPDGLALTPGGEIWVASPFTKELLLVSGSGELVGAMATEQMPYACAVDDSGRWLFACVSDDWKAETCLEQRRGQVIRFDLQA